MEVREWRTTKVNDEVRSALEWVSANNAQPGEGFANDASNWFLHSDRIYARNAKLGHYRLNEVQINKCRRSVPIQPSEDFARQIMATCRAGNRHF